MGGGGRKGEREEEREGGRLEEGKQRERETDPGF